MNGTINGDLLLLQLDDEIEKLETRAYGAHPAVCIEGVTLRGESGIDQLLTIAQIETLQTMRKCVLKSIR